MATVERAIRSAALVALVGALVWSVGAHAGAGAAATQPPAVVPGGLVWHETQVDLVAAVTDESLTGRFRFANHDSSAVIIDDIVSGCGCTVGRMERQRYEPGAEGALDAVFTIGSRIGRQAVTIRVTWHRVGDEGLRCTRSLRLCVDIPTTTRQVAVEPAVLHWTTGSEPKPLPIEVALRDEGRIIAVEAPPGFAATWSATARVGVYLVEVLPDSTDGIRGGSLRIRTHHAPGGSITQSVPLQVSASVDHRPPPRARTPQSAR